MVGDELRIKQDIARAVEVIDQKGERHFGRVGHGAKHAFAKESTAQGNAISAANEHIIVPNLDGLRVTFGV